MSLLRRISTPRLLALCAATVAVIAGGAAAAVALTGASPPPRRPLAVVVRQALASRPVAGVTARVRFANRLLPGASLGEASPLAGATGRLWLAPGGRLRLELQSRRGDDQLVSDGRTLQLYDGASSTLYRAVLGRERSRRHAARRPEPLPSLARIRAGLRRLGAHVALSPARPAVVAGRPAYTERAAARRHAGLLGAVELSADAVHGAPLGLAVYAKGVSAPVLELAATGVSFGPVSSGVFHLNAPAGAKVVDLRLPSQAAGRERPGPRGLAAVRRAVGFTLAAPASLAGRPRRAVEPLGRRGALVLYGRGLDGVAVLERPARGARTPALPTKLALPGASGRELVTPLGTIVRFDRGGVGYTVLGSQPRATVEAAARGL